MLKHYFSTYHCLELLLKLNYNQAKNKSDTWSSDLPQNQALAVIKN